MARQKQQVHEDVELLKTLPPGSELTRQESGLTIKIPAKPMSVAEMFADSPKVPDAERIGDVGRLRGIAVEVARPKKRRSQPASKPYYSKR